MPETTAPAANSTEARTPDGTILDQSQGNNSTTTTPQETSTSDPAPAQDSGPPADYTLTPPEGSNLDPKAIEGATAIFKELGLTQDQAQKLVEWGAKRETDSGNKSLETYNQMRTGWRAEVEADPEIGGGKLDATKAEIGKAIATLPPKLAQEFKDAMTLTGAGDHPAVVKTFLALAKSVNEGSHVTGGTPSVEGQRDPSKPARPSPAASMFPNLPTAH